MVAENILRSLNELCKVTAENVYLGQQLTNVAPM